MNKDCGQTLTQLFITSGWSITSLLIDRAFKEFRQAGWEEQRDPKTGFRCLTMFDADIETVRRAAKRNPGLMFSSFTIDCESDEAVLHVGIGGAWLRKTRRLSPAIGLKHAFYSQDYVRTMEPRGTAPRKGPAKSARGTGTKPQPAKVGSKAGRVAAGLKISNRLVFHGLPEEVEQCRVLVTDMLPEPVRAAAKYETTGNEQYLSGSMEIMTEGEPAIPVFNRLVARIPGVTVSLEYDDPKTATRRLLRAVDGKIEGSRAV